MYIEIGKVNAMAMVMETPGSAPKNRPIAIPGITHSQVSIEPVMRPIAAINADISNIFYLLMKYVMERNLIGTKWASGS
jgi:hypothetical protein